MKFFKRFVDRFVERNYAADKFHTFQGDDLQVWVTDLNTHLVSADVYRKGKLTMYLHLGTSVRVQYGNSYIDGKVGSIFRTGIEVIFYNDKGERTWELFPWHTIRQILR